MCYSKELIMVVQAFGIIVMVWVAAGKISGFFVYMDAVANRVYSAVRLYLAQR